MPAGTTGIGCARTCSTPQTLALASGPTRPIARSRTRCSWSGTGSSALSTATAGLADPSRHTSAAAMPGARGTGLRSSTCSQYRNRPWDYSSARSVSPEPVRRSAWPTSPSTSVASSSSAAGSPPDGLTAGFVRPGHLPRAFNPPFRSDSHSNLRHPRHYSRFSASWHPPPSVIRGSQVVENKRVRGIGLRRPFRSD